MKGKPALQLAPSILNADFRDLAGAAKAAERGGADWLHVDVMDGHMVPNLSMGAQVVRCLKRATRLPLDVHLMVTNPADLAPAFLKAGARRVTVHAELGGQAMRALRKIRAAGAIPGVALRPKTPLARLKPFLGKAKMVLLMSVEPGFGGQAFRPHTLSRVRRLRALADGRDTRLDIQVDGGIDSGNIGRVVAAGANVIVIGCAVYGSRDPAAALRRLAKAARTAAKS